MSLESPRLPAQRIPDRLVLSKLDFLADIQLWPIRAHLDPYRWLENFRATERPYALNILNVFLYLSHPIMDAMFRATVHSLSANLSVQAPSLANAKALWNRYLSTVNVTYVQGEQPRPTDSGLVFARKARQVLNISEDQITEPRRALRNLVHSASTPIMFVDDFVGSGNQMVETWRRKYPVDSGYETSFSDVAHRDTNVVYVPLVATQSGLAALNEHCPHLTVRPAHTIDSHYSLLSAHSVLWPDELRHDAADVIYNASIRAGIVENYTYGWKGFHDLALAIAFEHSIPDATLPIIFWEGNGWYPLRRKT